MHGNTRIMPVEFEYLQPTSKDEALEMLHKYENIKVLGGGTDLIVKLKTRTGIKINYMMYVKEIQELNYVRIENNHVKIGAVTPLSFIENNEIVKSKIPALSEAIKALASLSIKNMATIGGNICNSSHVADTIPPLIAYGAKLVLANKEGTREMKIPQFIESSGKNILEEDEMLTEIVVTVPKENTGAAFVKKSRVKSDVSKINVAVLIEREGDSCIDCRVVIGALKPMIIRMHKVEEKLKGKKLTLQLIKDAGTIVTDEIKFVDDKRSTAEYRYLIAPVVLEDAIKLAWKRSGGEDINV